LLTSGRDEARFRQLLDAVPDAMRVAGQPRPVQDVTAIVITCREAGLIPIRWWPAVWS